MIIDRSYKISAFGDFNDIHPTTENIIYLIEHLKDYNMVPSVIQETQINNINEPPIQLQRLSLISSDGKERVVILANRLDYEVISTDDAPLILEQRSALNEKICKIIHVILTKFNKNSSRLALNVASFIVNQTSAEIKNFTKKYSNPITIYNEFPLSEWSTHLMARKEINICSKQNTLNINTFISSVNNAKQGIIGAIESKGFSVNVDINTIAENSNLRFSATDLASFIETATTFWDNIIKEVG